MGTIRCMERGFGCRRDWKKETPRTGDRPGAANNNMGRRQSQRRAKQEQYTDCSQQHIQEKRPQQRRKSKCRTSSTQRNTHHSSHGASESKVQLSPPAEEQVEPKVQQAARHCSHKEHKQHPGFKRSQHSTAFPCHRLCHSSTDLREARGVSSKQEEFSDTDLSDSERVCVPPSRCVPPQLELRPEEVEAEGCSSHRHRATSQSPAGFDFPDFLPPPFNSWSLCQLALFYHAEGQRAPPPRPVGPLERYLEKLLQLEWRQIQTVQEESGTSSLSEVSPSCHVTPAAATSLRLSSPKCILQCQRAFPLTFLSCLAGHSALLSGCACSLCQIRYSACGTRSCRSAHARHSRLSPMLEVSRTTLRSYSETRVPPLDRGSRAQRFSSPVRTNSYLRRMQASGNIRNPVQDATSRPQSTARDSSDTPQSKGDICEHSAGQFLRSGGSEKKRGIQNGSQKRRSSSECRRPGAEWRRRAQLRDSEIKPDAVTAIMDNLPGSKYSPLLRPGRSKQVNFVT